MVGAGQLIELLFGLPYLYAVVFVGLMMIIYVTFGGMIATTWVQIIKACLLLAGASFMAIMVLWQFHFSPEALFAKAVEVHEKKASIMGPGNFIKDPISAISFGIALMFGTAGLPHILMRFFTVSDAKAARKSVLYGTCFIGYFYILTFIIGFGAIAFVASNPAFLVNAATGIALKGGANMPAVYLAQALCGDLFLGFIAAVAFATILAVVSGLTLAGASAISHDLYANVIAHGRASEQTEVRVSKGATVALGIVAILLGILFERQNVAYIVALTFSIAASSNFPILVMAMFWRGLTTRGALAGGYVGLLGSLVLVTLGPTVWGKVLGMGVAVFPIDFPTIITLPAAVIVAWLVSLGDKSVAAQNERLAFEDEYVRSQTGLGAEGAAVH